MVRVPADVVTLTSTCCSIAPGGTAAVSEVALVTRTWLACTPAKFTWLTPEKPVSVMVTSSPAGRRTAARIDDLHDREAGAGEGAIP